MCGIAGFITPGRRCPQPRQALQAMCDAIVHRGPDSEGLLLALPQDPGRAADATVALGMRRLAIIDTAGGHQPIFNEDGSVGVVFNGELYNYPDLRRQLEARGHRFSTHADTEVLVHLYEERGPDLARDLHGMFAFAIYDRTRERVVLGRDRLGIKPLHLLHQRGTLLFASELKSILAAPQLWPEGFDLRFDLSAVHALLASFYVPGPGAIFQGIRRLPPATVGVLDLASGAWREDTYWDLADTPSHRITREADALDALDDLLGRVVQDHLLSDVPVGAFVSGGVDSGLVASYAAERYTGQLQTFSVGFAEELYDETPDALQIVRALQTPHTLIHATFDNLARLLPKIFRAMDEPFGDSSMLPTFLVCELASRRLKVALSGDGGDEGFAGYTKHLIEHLRARLGGVPDAAIHTLQRALRLAPKGATGRLPELARMAEKTSRGLLGDSAHAYVAMTRLADDALLRSLLLRPPERDRAAEHLLERFNHPRDASPLQRTQYTDLGFALPDDMLTKVDRMSMLTSLEVRVPLLDHRVVEFGYHLPDHLKLRGRTTKHLLKQLYLRRFHLPRYAKRKQGFRVPIEAWLKTRLRPLIDYAFQPERLARQDIFNPKTLGGARAHDLASTAPHLLWNALTFQIFWDLQIERDDAVLGLLQA